MKLSQEIAALSLESKKCCSASLQKVLDMLSVRGRKAGLSAKDKSRGNSAYYSKLAKKRWKS